MLVGYARVPTQDQVPALQLHALDLAGCERVFQEKASGAQRDRPELQAAVTNMRKGENLVVWRLERQACSIRQLIETVEGLERRGIGFRSITGAIDTTSSGGRLFFYIFAALAEFERQIIQEPPSVMPAASCSIRARVRKSSLMVASWCGFGWAGCARCAGISFAWGHHVAVLSAPEPETSACETSTKAGRRRRFLTRMPTRLMCSTNAIELPGHCHFHPVDSWLQGASIGASAISGSRGGVHGRTEGDLRQATETLGRSHESSGPFHAD